MINRRSLVAIAALASAMACKPESANQANAAPPASQPGVALSGAPGGDKSGGRRGGGGRPASAITLAATDVAVVKQDAIESGIPITGDLRPIETIGVRARIEGDLTGVFVREGQRVTAGQVLAEFESSEQDISRRVPRRTCRPRRPI